MTGNKNLLIVLGEWWQHRQQHKQESSSNIKFRKLLPTPGNVIFTLLVLGMLYFAQSVGALPAFAPAAANTSTGTIAYQGRLADTGGTPLTNTYNMIFRLYGSATGGTPLWEEQWTGSNSVKVSDGLFNVMLGSLTPIPQNIITGNDTLFLGITVGTDNEMSPRVQLGSVPFAVQALTVPDGSITGAKIATGAITTTNIADGAVTKSKLANNSSIFIERAPADVTFDATGAVSTRVSLNTGIMVNVPAGSIEHYLVIYRGNFNYNYADRSTNKDSFYGYWTAQLTDNTVEIKDTVLVQTGYRHLWNAVGGNWYWNNQFSTSWIIELDGGIHNLDININGYSDNSMTKGNVQRQKIEMYPLF